MVFLQLWCVANQNGYIYGFSPYPGDAEKSTRAYDLGSSSNVVCYFAHRLRQRFTEPQNIHISMDNYFTSPSLLDYLRKDLNVYATGTLRPNRVRSLPIDLDAMKHEERGSYDYRYA